MRELFFLVIILCLALSCGQQSDKPNPAPSQPSATGAQTLIPEPSRDPISKAFEKANEDTQNTAEINFVADAYLKAWTDEFAHAASAVKALLPQQADKAAIDLYVAKSKELGKISGDLNALPWLDYELAPGKDRDDSMGTGASAAITYAAASAMKSSTLELITLYEALSQGKQYVYGFNGKVPDLEGFRNTK